MAPTSVLSSLHLNDVKKDLILLPEVEINCLSSSSSTLTSSTQKHGLCLEETENSLAKKLKVETGNLCFELLSVESGATSSASSEVATAANTPSSHELESFLYESSSASNTPCNELDFDIDSIISCPASPFPIADDSVFNVDTSSHQPQQENEKVKKEEQDETSIFLELNDSSPSFCPTSPETESEEKSTFLPSQDSPCLVEAKDESFDSLSPQAVRLLCVLDLESGEKLSSQTEENKSSTSSNNESYSDVYIRAIPYLVDSYGESILETLDSNGLGLVHYSAMEGLTQVFQFLEKKGYSRYMNIVDGRGYSSLAFAVMFKRQDTVSYMLEKGFPVSQSTFNGDTILKLACEVGDIKLLGLLLSKSKCVNEQDSQGKTALHCAVSLGRKDLVEVLMKHGALSSKKDVSGTTPLITAVMLGYHDFLSVLLKDKSALHVADVQGRTALHWAASVGNIPAAESLISQGAKLETRDKKGRTPFLLASFSQQLNMIRFLKDKNANKDVKDNEGREANFLSIL